ncbi:hypothetical protein VNO77_00463 [Canavalia gladiata]|uniref:Uncharacterized protein n=1 Tax=Canavalia gladiata TaxID=3824 RepID=A0AAN9MQ30_CANGL
MLPNGDRLVTPPQGPLASCLLPRSSSGEKPLREIFKPCILSRTLIHAVDFEHPYVRIINLIGMAFSKLEGQAPRASQRYLLIFNPMSANLAKFNCRLTFLLSCPIFMSIDRLFLQYDGFFKSKCLTTPVLRVTYVPFR